MQVSYRGIVVRYAAGIAAALAAMYLIIELPALIPAISYYPSARYLLSWLASSLLFPLAVLLALRMVGGLLINASYRRTSRALFVSGVAVKGVLGTLAFFYLFLGNTLLLALRLGLIPEAYASPAFGSAMLFVLGASVARAGGAFGGPPRSFLRYIGATVMLLGVSAAVSAVYAPLGTLIIYLALAMAIISLISLMGLRESLKPVAADASRVAGSIVFMFFIAGLLWFLAGLPLLSPYAEYIRLATPVTIAMVSALTGYRLYATYSRTSSAIAERVYEQHLRESKLVSSSDDEELVKAVSAFIVKGEKEELLAYISYALSPCYDEFARLKGPLTGLMKYVPPEYGGIWPWERGMIEERANADARKRKEIVAALLEEARKCEDAGRSR